MNGKTWLFVETEDCLVSGSEVARLTPRAAAVLACLVRNAGRTVSREELLVHVWGDLHVSPDLVREYIFDLRSALGDDARAPRYIETVRGKGFRLLGGVAVATAAADGSGNPPPAVADPSGTPADLKPGAKRDGEADARGLRLTAPDYREATALYCAVAERQAPVGRAEAEAVHQLMERAFERAGAVVERHEGTIVQRLEDGFLCLFGAPLTCEDHARRAVLASLELAGALNGGDPALPEPAFEVSVGIASGALLVGSPASPDAPQPWTARGQTIDAAKRLQALAGPGEILLGEATQRSIGSEILVEPLGDGADRAPGGEPAFRLRALRDLRSGVPRRTVAAAAPFVGRREELAILTERFGRAAAGQPQIVNVLGAPGIGKSRLVEEFRASLRPAVAVLEGRCFPHEKSTPYAPLRNIVRGIAAAGGATLQRSGLDAEGLAELMEILDLPAGEGAPPGPLGPSGQRQRLRRVDVFRALTELVLGLARDGPVVLVIEDLHWIDATSGEWLAEFLETLPGASLLVIATSREMAGTPVPAQAAITQLFLPTLVERDSEDLVRALLAGPEAPPAVVEHVVSRSGGNPFFLVELSLAMAGTGADRADAAIPETVQSVVLSRVDRLDELDRTILRICAVIGGEIPGPLLGSVTGLDDATLAERLADLQRGGFLSRDRGGPEPVLRFQHALLEEAVYQSLPLATLRLVHRRIVEALEEHLPQIPETRPEVAARHHESASNPESAIVYLQRAARRSYERSAHVEACQYAEKALALLGTLPDPHLHEALELDLLLTLAPAMAASRGYGAGELERVYDRALALCDGREGAQHWVKVHVGTWNYQWVRGELGHARRTAQELIAHAARHPRNLPRARAALGEIMFHAGELGAAHGELEAGIAAYDVAAERPLSVQIPHVACLCYAAWTAWHLGREQESLARAAEAARLARTIPHPFSYALCCALLAELHQFRLDIPACLGEAQRAINVSREHRFPFWEGTALVNRGWAVAHGGDFERGRRLMQGGIKVFADTGARIQMSCWTGMLADIHIHAGRFAEGDALVEEALGWVNATGEQHYLSELHRLRGDARRGLGGPDGPERALASYRAAIDAADRQGAAMRGLRATAGLAEVLAGQGRAAEARALLDARLAPLDQSSAAVDVRRARTLRDRL